MVETVLIGVFSSARLGVPIVLFVSRQQASFPLKDKQVNNNCIADIF